MLDPKCYPKCRLDNMVTIGKRKNPVNPKSSDYGLVGCRVCGTLWELRPEYEVEDRFGAGPKTPFEVTPEYVVKNYPNMYQDDFEKVLAAKNDTK